MALPPLREELALLPGPALSDGQPSHTLHDPVRNLYFQIDWTTFEILCRWSIGDSRAIADAVNSDTTLQIDADDVGDVVLFLQNQQLLQPGPGSAAEYAQRLKHIKGSASQWLLHNYLFFRIPILKPDRWLSLWVGRMNYFYSKHFSTLTFAALGIGLIEVYRDWESFVATLVDTLSWPGMLNYGITLIFIKTLHEFGHAVTAKRLGCRVPTMGIAFLVLWPVAYTDTNEVWKLTQRRQRLQVTAAGVITELVVAVWATLAWTLLPLGEWKSMAFLLATTTWITTVTINASPFMRFDGYFLLSDWLEMPNLHARAFALARWDLRERLFDLQEEVPEFLPARRHTVLILFAYVTWIYRLVLFLGIAALVYAFFIKAVGILLFIVEMGWFVLAPFYQEFKVWRKYWPQLRQRGRTRISGAIFLFSVLLLAVPWPTRISTSALLRPAQQWLVYAPEHARVSQINFREGQHVKAGTTIFQLESPELSSRSANLQAKLARLERQTGSGVFDLGQRAQWQTLQQEKAMVEAEWALLQTDAARYAPIAPFDGVLRDLDPELRPGAWLSRNEVLGRLVNNGTLQVLAYLNEEEVAHVSTGDTARFYADGLEGPFLLLTVSRIDSDASRTLAEPELSTLYGGTLQVREKRGILYPDRSAYRVTLEASEVPSSLLHQAWRGKVVIAGSWSVPAWQFARTGLTLFWREAGF